MTLRRSAALATALTLAALVGSGACSGDDIGAERAADPTTSDASNASAVVTTTTTEAPRLEQRPVDVALPVSFTAGDVVFEITAVEFSNATPGTYLEDEPDLLPDELLYVTFTARVDPTLSALDPPHIWPVKSFEIVTSDDRVIAGSGVDFADLVMVAAGEPSSVSVAFPADEGDLDGARFRLDDGVNPPVEVALAPPVAPSPATPGPPAPAAPAPG